MITVGILDEDIIYRKRLMEYLNHQTEYPMKAVSFADAEQMKEYQKGNYLEAVICADIMDHIGSVVWIPLGDGCGDTVAKYGNAAHIAKFIYDKMNLVKDREHLIVGVYSPTGDSVRTRISLELAGQVRGIYLGMEEYCSLDMASENTDQLLFYIKERREDIVSFFKESALDLSYCFGYPSVLCYLDYRELTKEDFKWFFQLLREEKVSVVVDIGTGTLSDLGILTLFDQIYLPMTKESPSSNCYGNFERLIHKKKELQTIKSQELWIKDPDNLKELVKTL
ncbi:MAG: hypothetical protein PHD70_10290 [Anaerostipes sp.]|nr:hypothetical protein [Anaerostipes sp.]MDD3746846.1 hypothetical protein [Anaerostipes sp.]